MTDSNDGHQMDNPAGTRPNGEVLPGAGVGEANLMVLAAPDPVLFQATGLSLALAAHNATLAQSTARTIHLSTTVGAIPLIRSPADPGSHRGKFPHPDLPRLCPPGSRDC